MSIGARQVEPGVFQIDLRFQGLPNVVAAYLLTGRDELALVETGPATTLDALMDGIRATGYEPERVTRLIVTHIHLDHAGAAGVLLERLPRSTLLVHRVGAPHLVDPSRLLASATRIYGPSMAELWGEVRPCPADRVIPLDDGDRIEVAGRVLRVIATPGHASHHHAYLDLSSGALFTGDVAGIRINGRPYVYPPTPPPDLDLGLWRQSLARLRALRPRRLYLTHFGPADDPDWHVDDLLCRLFLWAGWTSARLAVEPDTAAVACELQAIADAELVEVTGDQGVLRHYALAAGGYQMSIDGLARYFRYHRPTAAGI
jgi:glyoxylase-like metal-dependent hydrolase (beta-lactamase superfamily II)